MTATAIGICAATGAIGLWELVTGRGVPGRPPGRLSGRALRIVGAGTALGCLVAIALIVTRDQGFGFITFAMTCLVSAAVTIDLPRTNRAT
ncbi:MAG: hypothetical protein ABI334_06635 [Candidatus Dormiibacterota bacterium]